MMSPLTENIAKAIMKDLDHVSAFLECMTIDISGNRIRSLKLYEFYTMWSMVLGMHPLTIQEFTQEMQQKGFRRVKPQNRSYWCDIGMNLPNVYSGSVWGCAE